MNNESKVRACRCDCYTVFGTFFLAAEHAWPSHRACRQAVPLGYLLRYVTVRYGN